MPIFVFVVLLIPSFNVLSDYLSVLLNFVTVLTVQILIKLVTVESSFKFLSDCLHAWTQEAAGQSRASMETPTQ